MRLPWRAVDGDVRVPLDEAEWWGASLAVLVAVIHHPRLLAAQQPGTDPAEVAGEVLNDLGELRSAAACAEAQVQSDEAGDGRRLASVRRHGDEVVFSPGAEVANLAWSLELFARAVLEPESIEATIARGACAYAASAWSADIGRAAGSL